MLRCAAKPHTFYYCPPKTILRPIHHPHRWTSALLHLQPLQTVFPWTPADVSFGEHMWTLRYTPRSGIAEPQASHGSRFKSKLHRTDPSAPHSMNLSSISDPSLKSHSAIPKEWASRYSISYTKAIGTGDCTTGLAALAWKALSLSCLTNPFWIFKVQLQC